MNEPDLVKFLKDLDQPSSYKEFEPYIKRSHEEPTDLAKALRVPNGVSSDIAIQLSQCESYDAVMEIKGMELKNGERSKLFKKIDSFLYEIEEFYNTKFLHSLPEETGDEP